MSTASLRKPDQWTLTIRKLDVPCKLPHPNTHTGQLHLFLASPRLVLVAARPQHTPPTRLPHLVEQCLGSFSATQTAAAWWQGQASKGRHKKAQVGCMGCGILS